jgi:hypothetical protein
MINFHTVPGQALICLRATATPITVLYSPDRKASVRASIRPPPGRARGSPAAVADAAVHRVPSASRRALSIPAPPRARHLDFRRLLHVLSE